MSARTPDAFSRIFAALAPFKDREFTKDTRGQMVGAVVCAMPLTCDRRPVVSLDRTTGDAVVSFERIV